MEYWEAIVSYKFLIRIFILKFLIFRGGSTGINAMLYVCGADRDYDNWAKMGATGWDYDSVLPYIKKSENNTNPVIVGTGKHHGTAGPLTVSNFPSVDYLVPVLEAGFNQLEYKIQYHKYRFEKSQKYFDTVLASYGFKDEYIDQLVKINVDFEIVLTYSRGSVKLRSSSPVHAPKINSGLFSDSRDVDTLLRGINKLKALVATPAMQTYGASIMKFVIPECDPLPYPSDEYEKVTSNISLVSNGITQEPAGWANLQTQFLLLVLI